MGDDVVEGMVPGESMADMAPTPHYLPWSRPHPSQAQNILYEILLQFALIYCNRAKDMLKILSQRCRNTIHFTSTENFYDTEQINSPTNQSLREREADTVSYSAAAMPH